MNMKCRILFLCTGNSCRSQMAEGLLRDIARDRVEVISAGTHPVGLNPEAVAIMREIGIDISHHRSKSLESVLDEKFDYVITVCDQAKETCPSFTGAGAMLHWSFDDPAAASGPKEQRALRFRLVRDEIAARIQQFLEKNTILSDRSGL